MGQEEHCGEEDCNNPGACIDVLSLAGEGLDGNIGDQAEGNTVGDIVGQGHDSHGQEADNSGGGIVPENVLDIAHHQNADINQSGSSCAGRNELGNRSEEHSNEEHGCGGEGGEAGTAAFANTGSGLNESGNSGGTADGAGAGCDGVSKHSLFHVGNGFVAVLILDEHVAGGAGTVESTHGIEHIDHAECKHGGEEHDDESTDTVLGNIGGEVKAFGEDLAECHGTEITEGGEEVTAQVGSNAGSIEFGDGEEAENVINYGRTEHAPENGAANLAVSHSANGTESDDHNDAGHNVGPGNTAVEDVEGTEVDKGSTVINNEADVLHTDESNEEADTGCNADFNTLRNGIEDDLTETGCGEDDEHDAVNQNTDKGIGIGKTKAEANGIDEIRIQTHTGGLCHGNVGQKTNQDCTDDCGDRSRDVDSAVGNNAEISEHSGVDHQNVGHCHEGGDTGGNFSPYGGTTFLDLEELFHRSTSLFNFWDRKTGNCPLRFFVMQFPAHRQTFITPYSSMGEI